MELWNKVRIYFLIWIAIFLVIIVAAVIVYWDEIAVIVSNAFWSIAMAIIIVILVLWLIGRMIRGR